MGAVYSVSMKVKVTDTPAAIQALQKFIKDRAESGRCNWNLDKYEKEGVFTETFDDLMRIFLAGWKSCPFLKENLANGFTIYENEFNATYSWRDVMEDMWQVLKPFTYEGSKFIIEDWN